MLPYRPLCELIATCFSVELAGLSKILARAQLSIGILNIIVLVNGDFKGVASS